MGKEKRRYGEERRSLVEGRDNEKVNMMGRNGGRAARGRKEEDERIR